MPEIKKHIVFTYSHYTDAATVAVLKRLLSMFPGNEFSTHLLLLEGDRPDRQLFECTNQFSKHFHLYFSFDALGFRFLNYNETPYFNTLWTPCVTCLTASASNFSVELSHTWNLNSTFLCLNSRDVDYIQKHFPGVADVRYAPNPLQHTSDFFELLLSIANRYPIPLP